MLVGIAVRIARILMLELAGAANETRTRDSDFCKNGGS
jgi:hypothetical protein